MMNKKGNKENTKPKIYAADFETVVYKGQTSTAVWSSALCPVRTKEQQERGLPKPEEDDVIVLHSIDETLEWAENEKRNLLFDYHNLKFDGSFWIDFLLRKGFIYYEPKKKKDKQPGTFSALIGEMGQWYMMRIILMNGKTLELRDSLKLAPFSLEKLGTDFNTEHKKLTMEYKGKRYPGCPISEEELSYIKNDVLVLSEVLEIFEREGIEEMTIGSACMRNFKERIGKMYWSENFWNLEATTLNSGPELWNKYPEHDWGQVSKNNKETGFRQMVPIENADQYIRKAYRGGWCYCKPDKAEQVYNLKNCKVYTADGHKYIGTVADVNSLYP